MSISSSKRIYFWLVALLLPLIVLAHYIMKNVIISFFLFLALVLLAFCDCNRNSDPIHPSDDDMISLYNKNRDSFNYLLNEFKKSGLSEIRKRDYQIFENAEEHEEHNKFMETMDKLGISYIHIRGQNKPDIEFTVSSRGWVTGGSSKGYAYIENEEDRRFIDQHCTVDDLDRYFNNNSDFSMYIKLEKFWYIFCEHDG